MRLIGFAVCPALLMAVAFAAPSSAFAQAPKPSSVVGYLGISAPTTPSVARLLDAFRLGLREAGWIEGRTLRIELRWSEGRPERFTELARELVQLKADVIVTAGSQATQAAKEASTTIPIVFVGVGNPIGAGFVASLARPGGNVTGVTNQFSDLNGKWLQIAREAVPGLRRVAILWSPADQSSAVSFKEAQESYPAHGVKVISAAVRSPEDVDGVFDVLSRDRPDFLMVHPSPVIFFHRQRVAEFALRHRLPTSTGQRGMVEDDSMMMSYGPDAADLFRRAAVYVDISKHAGRVNGESIVVEQLAARSSAHLLGWTTARIPRYALGGERRS